MPKYSIIATSTDAGRVLTIQDERTLDELASDLNEDGYIISTDVTPIAGHPGPPSTRIALLRANVISIKAAGTA